MSKRFTDTDLWDKEWFMELSVKHKCLVRFLFDKCDSAGVWSSNWMLASSYIGEKVTLKDLEVLGDRVIEFQPGKFFIVDFIGFQYGKLSENCKPHLKIISLLNKYELFERVSKGYTYPIQRVEEKDKEKEEEKEEEVIGGVGENETVYKKFAHLSLSDQEFLKLCDLGYSVAEIDNVLESIENYKKNKVYVSLFLTAKKWMERDRKTQPQSTRGPSAIIEAFSQIQMRA